MLFPKIASNYKNYCTFIDEKKNISSSPIILAVKPNNPKWLKGEVTFHTQVDSRLIVQALENNLKYFGFQIIVNDFGESSCFRFDSDGPTHKNTLPSLPLSERQITTPHFHRVHETGHLIAFKTQKLLDEKEKKALISDINLAIAHFSSESNIRYDDHFPEVQSHQVSLNLQIENEDDPLNGINFEMVE
jgi:hypothetical protein